MKRSQRWRRWCGRAGALAAVVLVTGGLALGARGSRGKEPPRPSYAISNIVAMVMSGVLLAIPCKRFRRT